MTSASQKSEGRAFADNIRQPEEMKNALVWLFDTDASQLAGFLRSGPAAGRAKLLLACSKAVCEPPNPAPASSDSPPVAPTSKGAATIPPASVASDVNAAPAASADAAPDIKEPQHDGTGAGTPAASAAAAASSGDTKDVKEPPSDASATSVAKGAVQPGNVEAPIASAGGGTDSAATPGPSPPPGAPTPAETTSDPVGPSAPDGASPAPPRFDHVAPPTFLDTSEIPRRAKVSTRQVLCCRETCSICFQACCGYSSELPRDSHFEASDVHHRCKACYRASRANKTTDAPSSTSATYDASQDTNDSWHHASQDSAGSWQHSSEWNSGQGRWEWDSWNGQWMWY